MRGKRRRLASLLWTHSRADRDVQRRASWLARAATARARRSASSSAPRTSVSGATSQHRPGRSRVNDPVHAPSAPVSARSISSASARRSATSASRRAAGARCPRARPAAPQTAPCRARSARAGRRSARSTRPGPRRAVRRGSRSRQAAGRGRATKPGRASARARSPTMRRTGCARSSTITASPPARGAPDRPRAAGVRRSRSRGVDAGALALSVSNARGIECRHRLERRRERLGTDVREPIARVAHQPRGGLAQLLAQRFPEDSAQRLDRLERLEIVQRPADDGQPPRRQPCPQRLARRCRSAGRARDRTPAPGSPARTARAPRPRAPRAGPPRRPRAGAPGSARPPSASRARPASASRRSLGRSATGRARALRRERESSVTAIEYQQPGT